MKSWMWIGVALLGSTNGEAAESRIIGGTDATAGAWPWIVSLENSDLGADPYASSFCGGSLIASDWVLTAAHCAVEVTTDNLRVRVGGHDLSSSATAGSVVAVDRILIHPGYNQATAYDQDLALLHLASPQSTTPLPAISASAMSSLTAGTTLTVMGWGATQATSPYHYPYRLQQVSVPLVSDSECATAYPGQLTNNMFCAGVMAGGKDSCYGDSGGPIILGSDASSAQQVGVVSWGDGCAAAGKPGIYTRLANYTDWLAQHQSHLSMDTYTHLGYFPVGYQGQGSVLVINNGDSAASLGSAMLDSKAEMSLASNGCSTAVAAGGQCSLSIAVTSSSAGEVQDRVRATDSVSSVELEGVVGATFLAQAALSNAPTSSLWYTGGDGNWQDGGAVDGRQPLVAGRGFEDSETVLQTQVTGPATVSFEWQVSGGDGNTVSRLHSRLDGVEQGATSSSGWQTRSVSVGAGTHLLEWTFTKREGAPLLAEAQLATLQVTTPSEDDSDGGSSGGGSVGWFSALLLLGLVRGRRR